MEGVQGLRDIGYPQMLMVSMEKSTIVERISTAVAGMSISAAARRLGMNAQTLHNYLNGREPPLGLAINICREFGVSPKWFLTGEGDPWEENKERAPQVSERETGEDEKYRVAEVHRAIRADHDELIECYEGLPVDLRHALLVAARGMLLWHKSNEKTEGGKA